ncbi:hypothetical protein DF039_38560, partial [Burkholderia cenocepacia]
TGNVTVGDEKTTDPVLVEVGDQDTQHVTQSADSRVTVASESDALISMTAQKVLALSGWLFAPNGEISLSSTILDTGLMVPVADRVNLAGVEVWTKLPLKTGNGLAVYLGKDQMFYAEDGQRLDPTTHLYDEIGNRDVGE